MIDVKLYQEAATDFVKSHTQKVIDCYGSLLKWKENGKEMVLDVGCGEGSTTVQILQNLISKNVKDYHILATDYLDAMIHSALEEFSDQKSIEFKQADILDEQRWIPFKENFDKVFSILCLMIVPNAEVWIQNIYNVLKPGGQIFLMVTSTNPMLKQHFYMSQQEKWLKYQKDNIHNTQFLMQSNHVSWLVQYLSKGGFKNVVCHEVLYDSSMKDAESSYRFIRAFKGIYQNIPTSDQEEYLKEMCDNIEKNVSINEEYSKVTYLVVVADK